MSRCSACDSTLQKPALGKYGDLCEKCTSFVKAALRDKSNFIPREKMHMYSRDGLTPARDSNYN